MIYKKPLSIILIISLLMSFSSCSFFKINDFFEKNDKNDDTESDSDATEDNSSCGDISDSSSDNHEPSYSDVSSEQEQEDKPKNYITSSFASSEILVSRFMDYTYPTNAYGDHGAHHFSGGITDGYWRSTFAYTYDWFGLLNDPTSPDHSNALSGYGDFVFDFKETMPFSDAEVIIGNDGSLIDPEITIFISDNGSDWEELGLMKCGHSRYGSNRYSAGLIDYSARYIKFRVTCPRETRWAFVGEISVTIDADASTLPRN